MQKGQTWMLRRLGCMPLVAGEAPSGPPPAPQAGPDGFLVSDGVRWTLPAMSMGADFFSRCANGMRRPPATSALPASAAAVSSPVGRLGDRPLACALTLACVHRSNVIRAGQRPKCRFLKNSQCTCLHVMLIIQEGQLGIKGQRGTYLVPSGYFLVQDCA